MTAPREPRTYGYSWEGRRPEDPTRCIHSVMPEGWAQRPHQCRHKRTVGDYCRQHAPAGEATATWWQVRATSWRPQPTDKPKPVAVESVGKGGKRVRVDGSWVQTQTKYVAIYPTWAEAHAHLVEHWERTRARAAEQLQTAADALGHLGDLQEPTA